MNIKKEVLSLLLKVGGKDVWGFVKGGEVE